MSKLYPFEPVLKKMKETLVHPNGQVRLFSQEILVGIYRHFGFTQTFWDHASAYNYQSLVNLSKRIPDLLPMVQQAKERAGSDLGQANMGGGDSISWTPNMGDQSVQPSPAKKPFQQRQQVAPQFPACQFCGLRQE
mmetsp:Transcript_7606/g.11827  ORF Transcript_7606/g.11827 Transcript_7606/m.11827 type:complete len:136 (+) Transcript_7606:2042-2449(+)